MKFSTFLSSLTLCILASACTSQNLLDADGNPIPESGAAFEAIDSAQTINQLITEETTPEEIAEIATEKEIPLPPVTSEDVPEVRFKGTSISEKYVGDTVNLVGSYSHIDNGEIILYRWSQPDNGQPRVEIENSESSNASFIASPELNGVLLTFELKVIGHNYSTKTGRFMYAWTVLDEAARPVEADTQIDTQTDSSSDTTNSENDTTNHTSNSSANAAIRDGYYTLGTTGDYFAKSVTSVYIADQDSNSIVHVDADSNQVLNTYQLTDAPKYVEFVDATNSLYVSFKFTANLVKINLDTDEITNIGIAGAARDLHSHEDSLFYTVDNAIDSNNYDLYSLDLTDVPVSHGTIAGNLIAHNPANNELITADSYEAGASVYEYDVNGQVMEVQTNSDISSDAEDIAVSPNGMQLAIATPTGNGGGYTIHDIMPTDLSVSNGAWDMGAYPNSVAFSMDGSTIATTNTTDLKIFDSVLHTELEHQVVDFSACGLDYYELDNASYTLDGKHVFVRLECGFDEERTTLFYYELN